jgi:hypothetical protein
MTRTGPAADVKGLVACRREFVTAGILLREHSHHPRQPVGPQDSTGSGVAIQEQRLARMDDAASRPEIDREVLLALAHALD